MLGTPMAAIVAVPAQVPANWDGIVGPVGCPVGGVEALAVLVLARLGGEGATPPPAARTGPRRDRAGGGLGGASQLGSSFGSVAPVSAGTGSVRSARSS